MPRTYKGGVTATSGNDSPVDPLRMARLDRKEGQADRSYNPSVRAVVRGILGSPTVMDELLRQMAWYEPAQMEALCEAWKEAQAGKTERLEMYRTRPASEWRVASVLTPPGPFERRAARTETETHDR